MACLNPGVLVKLIEDMNAEEPVSDDRKHALLQIRSIVPVLAEGDLWPNQGFYLKVSDASHAMYVSLPHEQDEFILGNKLHLGQFIYVDRLETSHPVPLLIGVRPYQGRKSCTRAPKDLISMDDLVEISGASDQELVKEVISESEEKPRPKGHSTSGSMTSYGIRTIRNFPQRSSSDRYHCDSDCSRKADLDSDTESTLSACSSTSRISKRRSWNDSDNTKLDDILEIPPIRLRLKPIRHCTNTKDSSGRHDVPMELPISKPLRKGKSELSQRATKSMKGTKFSTTSRKTSNEVLADQAAIFSTFSERNGTEDTILWASLPSSLLMLGKEVLKQRDAALCASMEALQEAAATERMLKCLSAYSELQASNSDDHETTGLVDQFFNLQDNLSESRLILQSLSGMNSSNSFDSDDESEEELKGNVLRVASERKKNSELWVKAALASDLTIPTSPEQTSDCNDLPKAMNTSYKLGRAEHKVKSGSSDRKLVWSRGSSLCATKDLVSSLLSENRTLFLGFVEQYLDTLRHKFSQEQSSTMMRTMLQIKKVGDWIDVMAKKDVEGSKICSRPEDPEFDAYGSVKNKIYRILLMHIEKTALAWETMTEASLQ